MKSIFEEKKKFKHLINDPSVKSRIEMLKAAGVKYEIIEIKPIKTVKEKS